MKGAVPMIQHHHYTIRSIAVAVAVVALLFGCSGDKKLPLIAPDGGIAAVALVSDGVNGGNSGFFFLPPMVPHPEYSGTFDADQSPEVTITGADLSILFTMQPVEDAEYIRVDEQDECYIVNWHLNNYELQDGAVYRITVSVDGSSLGFADVQVFASGKELRNSATLDTIAIKDGRTLPVKFRIEQSDCVYTIPPDEEVTITTPDNLVNMDIPANAVDENTTISIEPVEPDEIQRNMGVLPGTMIDFGPDGLVFNTSVTLTITYDETALPAGIDEESLVLLHEKIEGIWEVLHSSQVDAANNTVTAPINGFSNYSIAPGGSNDIVFISTRNGERAVYTMQSNGTNPVRLTNGVDTKRPAFSPDGSKIVYQANLFGANYGELHVMNSNGTGDMIIVAEEVEFPEWSPDGSRIVYWCAYPDSSVHVVDSDGSNNSTLPASLSAFMSATRYPPVWSPDGQNVVIAGNNWPSQTPGELIILPADGSTQIELTDLDDFLRSPQWSPIGDRIVFCQESNLMFADAVTGSVVNLTNDTNSQDDTPYWSSDGSRIVFVRTIFGTSDQEVFLINADGSGLTNLSNNPGSRDHHPRWWPDGSRILFESYRDDSRGQLYTVDVTGSVLINLSSNTYNDYIE